MHMAMFDILEYFEQLKATGVPEAQAKLHAELYAKGLGEALSHRDLVTRDHLDMRIQEVRTEIQEVRTELHKEIQEVRTEIQKVRAELIRWMAGLMLAQVGAIVALVKLIG